jgi:hypothetical protein
MKLRYALSAGLLVMLMNGCVAVKETSPEHAVSSGKKVTIAAGSFYEACDKWEPGQEVTYSFETSKAVDFNVHYHSHEGKVYPVKKDNTSSLAGNFEVQSAETHCSMWTNSQSSDVTLIYNFEAKYERPVVSGQ